VNTTAKKNYLQTADDIIHGARNRAYGHPLDNHSRTAQMWGAYLGIPLTPEQVCDMNALQKLSRNASGQMHEDNDVDVAGYMGNKEMIRDERLRRVQADLAAVEARPPRPMGPRRIEADISDLAPRPATLTFDDDPSPQQ
jgi:hypothetical protein